MKITQQIHYINPKDAWSKIETVSLEELFWNYKENPKQIIRWQNEFYNLLVSKLLNWEVNLFNTTNNEVNHQLIKDFHNKKNEDNKALIAKIYWEKWIIIENSLKVIDVLEMWDYSLNQIYKKELYKNWIKDFTNIEELLKWLEIEFYKWNISLKELLETKKLFSRQIKLN
jgi:hypothetical protein